MAIDDLLDEHEQSERVRNWLRKNGAGIISGVVVGVAAIWGFQLWKNHQTQRAHETYVRYGTALKEIDSGALDKVPNEIAAMSGDGERIYAALVALQLAKAQVEADKIDEAIATLKAIPANELLQSLVNSRLARLMVDSGKAEDALKLLEGAKDSASLEIRGDALAALDKNEQARDAYNAALASLDVAAPQRQLLEMKLMDVGGTVPESAEPI
ncbi:MAG: tetratricopeptide repeat protein [Xanthomonadaceae bacterium]|jgi:predicted negative regulator of RcsB-dependent stress response|nr:tetratricopeptide repeat protein [Xanthomonadaceae bacterium]